MYHEYTQDELRSFCKQNIENLEIWARNLIHEKLTTKYGSNYIQYKTPEQKFLIKKEIRQHVDSMQKKDPDRYKRGVDALYIDHIIYFLCHDKFYNSLFKEALDEIYPDGREEVRTMLTRLIPIRNLLSHSNPISMHQVERAICYSHDFIEGLKNYYSKKGKERMWNVPRIIKIKDSFGNVFNNFKDESTCVVHINQLMHVGDSYSLEIEIDPTFSKKDYTIEWKYKNKVINNDKENFHIKFSNADVSENNSIDCEIIQNKEWHKYTYHDFRVLIFFTVLPPIDQ